MAEALSSSPLFEDVTLASMPCIMKASPSSDMSVIWIDIWDSQKRSKGKTLINHSFNFGCHTATVRGTAIYSGVAQCRNCWCWRYPTHAVALKALNIRNVVVLIKLRTTDCWLGVVRPIPSLTLLGRRLQIVYLVLTLSSV